MGQTRTFISKITPPVLPKVIRREALFGVLDRKTHYSATWISATAGAGKTTLVASYLNSRKRPFIWYRIDSGDGDLPAFFYYLGLAVRRATPKKRKPLPLLTEDFFPGVEVFARHFFENLSIRLSQPCFIVFDDFHHVATCDSLQKIFKGWLSSLPPQIHVLIAGRTDPPSAFASLLVNKQMRLIESQRLRLDLAETDALVRLETGRQLPRDLIRQVHEQSEGWAAGLVLMAKGIHGKSLSAPRPPMLPEVVYDYFSTELFEKMPDEIKEFLLRTAFLPRMTIAMAEEIAEHPGAARILDMLHHSNSFTEKFCDNPLGYQYHALFRKFLLGQALNLLGNKKVTAIKSRAATLLAATGWVEDAAWLFNETGDIDGLEGLLQDCAAALIDQGRTMTIESWLNRIPTKDLAQHPWLSYWWGMTSRYRTPGAAQRYFIDALNGFLSAQNETALWLAWAGIIESIVNEWHDFRKLDPWLDWGQQRWHSGQIALPEETEARAAVAMMTALLIRRPEAEELPHWVERAQTLAAKGGHIDAQIQADGWIMTYEAWMGHFDKVAALRKESRALARSHHTHPPMQIHWRWIDISTRLCTMSGKDSILNEVANAIELIHKTGLFAWEHKFFMPGIFAALLLSDFETAATYLQKFEANLDKTPYHGRAIFHHFSGLYQLLSGNLSAAHAHAECALRLAEETGYTMATALCRIQLAYTHFLQGDPAVAQETLLPAQVIAHNAKSAILEFMCLLVSAGISRAQQPPFPALEPLKSALTLGRRHSFYTMVWWWHPELMSYVCGQALLHKIEPDYVKKLVHTHHLTPGPEHAATRDWPWALRIKTLGTFQMLRNGEPVCFRGKVQKRPLELLKLLIAQGGKEIPVDRIMDALWPNADGDMAGSAFSSTLNRLRNLIGIKAAISLSQGRVSFDRRYVWVDAQAFETLLRRFHALKAKADQQEILACCEQAIAAYAGDFLLEETGVPGIIAARERWRNGFLEVLKTAGRCREDAADWDKAMTYYQKGLSVDPLDEFFYQRLMACHYQQRDYSKAVKVYLRCREMLKKHFDVPPAKATEDLYREIQQPAAVRS